MKNTIYDNLTYELLEQSGNFEVKNKITEVENGDKLDQKEKQRKFETELNTHISDSVKTIYNDYESIRGNNRPEGYKKQDKVDFDKNSDVKQLGTNMKLISGDLESVLKNNSKYSELRQKVDNIILLVDQLDELEGNKNSLEERVKKEVSHEVGLFKKKFDETKGNDTFYKTKESASGREKDKEDIETFKNNITINAATDDLTVGSVTKSGDGYDATFEIKSGDAVSKTTLYFDKDGKFKANSTDQEYVSEGVYDIGSYKLLVKKGTDNKISVSRSRSAEELKQEATRRIDLGSSLLSISGVSYEPKLAGGTDMQGYDEVRIGFKDHKGDPSSFVVDSNSRKLVTPRDTSPNMMMSDITYTITQEQGGKIKIEKKTPDSDTPDVAPDAIENPNKAIIDKLNSINPLLQSDSDYVGRLKRNQVDENVGIVQSSLLAINKIPGYEGMLQTGDDIIEGNFVDKKFGQLTYDSVKAFQEKYKDTLPDTEKDNFIVDGLPGKQTIDAIVKVLENSKNTPEATTGGADKTTEQVGNKVTIGGKTYVVGLFNRLNLDGLTSVDGLKDIERPNYLQIINLNGLTSVDGLKDIKLPASLTYIYLNGLTSTKGLDKVERPKDLETIYLGKNISETDRSKLKSDLKKKLGREIEIST